MKTWDAATIAELLKKSGKIALECKNEMAPEMKKDHSIVTRADKAVEFFLGQKLTEGESDVYIIGEESIESCDLQNALKKTAFIIDPIDGTAVYAAGLPMWGISIGFSVAGVLQESAIYLPDTEDLMITDSGKTFLQCGDSSGLEELHPFEKEYTETGAVSISQRIAKKGNFCGSELLQSIGSCVYPGVFMAKQIYMAGIFRAKIWDVAGFLPALKNLGFVSANKQGTDLMSLKISPECYDLDENSDHLLMMKCHNVIASSAMICDSVLSRSHFPEE